MIRRWRQRRLWTRMNQQIDGTKLLADAALLPPGSIIETPIAAIFGKLELTTRAADVERINKELLFLTHPNLEPPSTLNNNLLGNVELQITNVEWIDHGAVPRDQWTDERWTAIVDHHLERPAFPVHPTPEGNRLEDILYDVNIHLAAFLEDLKEMNR